LNPGIGFGGFCFPKDLQAFVRIGEKLGCDFSLLREVEKINIRRTEQFVAKIKKELWVLRGKTLAVWGLAFKPNTDDVRFAPALSIIRRLQSEGAKIRAYDPEAMQKAKLDLPEVTYCESSYQAAEGADAILILTEWTEFREINWKHLTQLVSHRLIIDGRNLLSAEEASVNGFQYVGIGRAAEPLPPTVEVKRAGTTAAPLPPTGHQVPTPMQVAP
jgi:UDPglucose 6-dehydrogenase